ncbi:MAG: hypothetical protein P4L20_02850 [Acidimicrobiales bacterium]|nr:hypothetical protein [Acidimicrobiales bacterium]
MSVDLRSSPIKLVIGFGVALALSACSSSPSPGVITQADIPSYLGVRANPTAAASEAQHLGTLAKGCKAAGNAIFSVPGARVITKINVLSKAPEVLNGVESCAAPSEALNVYDGFVKNSQGRTLPRIGNEGKITDLSGPRARAYGITWRVNNQIGILEIEGPTSDKRITSGLAELLARRAAARS